MARRGHALPGNPEGYVSGGKGPAESDATRTKIKARGMCGRRWSAQKHRPRRLRRRRRGRVPTLLTRGGVPLGVNLSRSDGNQKLVPYLSYKQRHKI